MAKIWLANRSVLNYIFFLLGLIPNYNYSQQGAPARCRATLSTATTFKDGDFYRWVSFHANLVRIDNCQQENMFTPHVID